MKILPIISTITFTGRPTDSNKRTKVPPEGGIENSNKIRKNKWKLI